jgi:hypothetical protein
MLVCALFCASNTFAQSPQAFNYQGVARDAGGDALVNTTIGVEFQVHQTSAGGTVVYAETHAPTTNEHGLFSVEVGNGTPGTGTFATIDWSAGPYFLEVGLDPAGGSSYTSVGTQQLLSVPYALHAGSVDMADDGDWVLSGDTLHSDGKRVGIGTATPSTDLDVEGSFQLKDGTQADKKILTSDADGNASWENLNGADIFGSGNVPPVYSEDISCLNEVMTVPTGSGPEAVAISGSHAYVLSSQDNKMMIYDLSDPASPVPGDTLTAGNHPRSLAFSGSHAYMVNDISSTMTVYDLSDPASPVPGVTVPTGSYPVAVVVSASHAYVVNYFDNTLSVFDLSDPSSPAPVNTVSTGIGPGSMAISGTHAYVLNYDENTMTVYDLSDPASPVQGVSVPTGDKPRSVAVSGSHAYVVNQFSNTMTVYDLSDPASPAQGVSVPTGTEPRSVAVSGSHAYVLNRSSDTMTVYDLDDPASPAPVDAVPTGAGPVSIAVSGPHAYVLNSFNRSMIVFELFCPNSPGQVVYDPVSGDFSTSETTWNTDGDDISNANSGSVGIGTTEPDTTLHVVGKIKYQDGSQGPAKFLTSDADGNATWQALELTPSALMGASGFPVCAPSTFATGTAPSAMVLDGDLLYVVNATSNDLRIFDVQIPNAAVLLSTTALPANSNPVDVARSEGDDLVYVLTEQDEMLRAYDISDPTAPTLRSAIQVDPEPRSIAVRGRFVYVLDNVTGSSSLKNYNFTNPSAPSLHSSPTLFHSNGTKLLRVGDRLYSVQRDRVYIIDISDPASAVYRGQVVTGDVANKIAVSGNYLYVTKHSDPDLYVWSIPLSGPPVFSTTVPGISPGAVYANGTSLYVLVEGSNTMLHYDISTPEAPVAQPPLATGSTSISVAENDGRLFVLNQGSNNVTAVDLNCSNGLGFTSDGNFVAVPSAPALWETSGADIVNTNYGKVGIGVSSPEYTLHLSNGTNTGSSAFGTGLKITGNSPRIYLEEDDANSGEKLMLMEKLNNGISFSSVLDNGNFFINQHILFAKGNGSVGIGTDSPVARLHTRFATGGSSSLLSRTGLFMDNALQVGTLFAPANVALVFGENGNAKQAIIGDTWGNDRLRFFTASNFTDSRLTIIATGDVGIGTDAPTAKLSVNGTANKTGGGSWAVFSDRRLKKDISLYDDGLSSVLAINPVKFKYNGISEADTTTEYIGVIAQELEKVSPYMINTIDIDGTEYLEVDNSAMTYMLINAIKELNATIEAQQAVIASQGERIESLNASNTEQARTLEANTTLMKELQSIVNAQTNKLH